MASVDAAQLLQKQRNAIAILKRDNAALGEELRLQNKHSVLPTTTTGNHLLDQLQDECDVLTRKIGLKKSILADTQAKCSSLSKKLEQRRQSMGGFTAAAKQNVKANRSVKQHENRLQAAMQHRNEALAATWELRGRIEGLRRERLACGEILQKSQGALRLDQKTIIRLLTESTGAAEQREAARHSLPDVIEAQVLGEITSLHTKLARVIASSEAEWSQLSHVIQQDRQSRENARQEDIEERERRTQALVKAEIGTQRRASAATWGIARNKAAQNASAVRMAQLTADFEAVQTATGTDNPDALAEQVTAAEDTKHRLFSFIGQLNGELEFMDAQISLLQQEVHSTIQAAAAKREQRSGIQKEWDEQLGAALREAEMFEARAGRALLQLNAVRGAVSELFEAAECSMQAAQQVLDSGAISASNLMQYLGFVEQSIDQLLRAFSHVAADRQYEAGKGATRVKHDSSGGKAAAGQGLLLFEPPSVPTAVSGRHEGPAGEDEMELLLDGHALLAAAEQSLRRRMEEGKMVRPGVTTGIRHGKISYK